MSATETYSHGHHESVLRSHAWRTAENSAAYLLPHLRAGLDLLDVGCGPGTLTRDLAARVAPGRVVGIDRAMQDLESGLKDLVAGAEDRLRFEQGDVYALGFDDASFDVVHAHQVLQHLGDPVAALREMKRVLKPGGLLAVRDSDYAAFAWAPAREALTRWNEVYHAIARRNGAEPDAGRFLLQWVRAAGFTDAVVSGSTWTFADADSRRWWGGLWADRVTESAFARQAIDYGLAGPEELGEMAAAWRTWAEEDDGCFFVVHGEVLARA